SGPKRAFADQRPIAPRWTQPLFVPDSTLYQSFWRPTILTLVPRTMRATMSPSLGSLRRSAVSQLTIAEPVAPDWAAPPASSSPSVLSLVSLVSPLPPTACASGLLPGG